ncbi:MAG: cold shock domain-containing protein, partial [Verrucomicrobia bacterium]|nr:cold shock domain-containing protein [Verrucomicrobiota bacterium]
TGSSLSYTYDYADRLVSVSDSGVPVASYAYDALGRRVSKTVGGATTRRYCYDGSCVIEERDNSAVAASYVLDDRGLLGLRLGTQDYFVHTDDQGNVLALTTTGGAVVERYDYDDYGAVTFLTSDGMPTSATSSAVGNPYCWGGLRLDVETGLLCDDGGEYLDPQTGRAVRGKVKVVKDMGGSCFAGNNPWSSSGGGGGGGSQMQKGTVKFFNETKGFGFIKEEGGQDSKHYITIPHNLSRSSVAYGVEYLARKKDYVGHVTLMK